MPLALRPPQITASRLFASTRLKRWSSSPKEGRCSGYPTRQSVMTAWTGAGVSSGILGRLFTALSATSKSVSSGFSPSYGSLRESTSQTTIPKAYTSDDVVLADSPRSNSGASQYGVPVILLLSVVAKNPKSATLARNLFQTYQNMNQQIRCKLRALLLTRIKQ